MSEITKPITEPVLKFSGMKDLASSNHTQIEMTTGVDTQKIYHQMMIDVDILTAFKNVQFAIASSEYELVKSGNKAIDSFIEYELSKLNIEKILSILSRSIAVGFQTMEIYWNEDYTINDVVYVDNRAIKFNYLGEPLFIPNGVYDPFSIPTLLNPLNFMISKFGVGLYGSGLLESAYPLWRSKSIAYKMWLDRMQKTSIPTITAKTQQGLDSETLSALSSGGGLAVSIGSEDEVDYLEPRSSTTDYSSLIELCQEGIGKLFLGTASVMSGIKSGNYSTADIHEATKNTAIKTYVDIFASDINEQLIKRVIDLNFENVEVYPYLEMNPKNFKTKR